MDSDVPLADRFRSGHGFGRLLAVLAALALAVAACSSADQAANDGAEVKAGTEPDSDSGSGDAGNSEPDGGAGDGGVSDESGGEANDIGAAQRGLGSDFDYSTIDYDAEPAGDALRGSRDNPAFPPPLVDPGQIRSALPPDGIPAVDNPVFVSASQVDFVPDTEPVVVVDHNDVVKAYPIQIMTWHEIVNDDFDGVPVSVTYCPLCNSALAYDRRLGERVLDFGTSGSLYQSAMVMYDRQTGSLWAHFTGQGIVGHYAGAQLNFIPAQTISFANFVDIHPDGLVLTTDTGHVRNYGENPYPGYDIEDTSPYGMFFTGEVDRTLLAKARVVGINDDAGSVAVRLEDLMVQPVIAVTEAGRNLVVFHQPGLPSALDTFDVEIGKEVGQTGVFEALAADGTGLTFSSVDEGRFVDDQTGSTWNIQGQAVEGPLTGEQLEAVVHLDTFWFAWSTYRPETTIVRI